MKFQITNVTKNKVVLVDEFADIDAAKGKYISLLYVVGIVTHCERDIEGGFRGESTFRVKSKGWDFKVEAV